jgi:hypothetical protein
MFPIKIFFLKQEDSLLPLLFNFALGYTFEKFQVNHDGLKLNYARQLLVHAKNFNILGGNLPTTKKTTELFLVPIKGTGLDIKLSTWS